MNVLGYLRRIRLLFVPMGQASVITLFFNRRVGVAKC
jgi:hypothetical protein